MQSETYIKDTPTLIVFSLLFIIIFGYWLQKRITAYNFQKNSKILFFIDNLGLIVGFLLGVGLLFIALFL
ncbi:hypothetical protein ACFYKX_03360 [Cytobacillus sp. FJAT-54145]|uniref:Uncharacterized protein n=1 Tax=Cytobacillus spartinae TaxID=3299023 RepID=A0ABW6K636_9BACI